MTSPVPWFADCARYRPLLEQVGLSEEDYLSAIGEVQRLMSVERAREEVTRLYASGNPVGPFDLHPTPGQRLTHHPLPTLLFPDTPAVNLWADLTRLGLDLVTTRALDGIEAKRRLLLNFDQYLSTLFEIEVFAELARAKLNPTIQRGTPDCIASVDGNPLNVEVKLAESRFGTALFHAIGGPLFFRDDWGTCHVHLEPGVGGRGERVQDIAALINADIQLLIEEPSRSPLSRNGFRIEYKPIPSAREFGLSFGREGTHAQMLEAYVRRCLEEKEEKLLLQLGSMDCTSLVALDLRCLAWGVPRPDGHFSRDEYTQSMVRRGQTREHREALLRGIKRFLGDAKVVAGVLSWWRKFDPELSVREACLCPWEIGLTTTETHEVVLDPHGLAALCRDRLFGPGALGGSR